MGLAASQAQLLSITSRMSDNELRAQLISNSKMRLASESSKVSAGYINALNESKMMFTNYDANNNSAYQELTFNSLTSYNPFNNQYGMSNMAGQLLVPERDAYNFKQANGSLDNFLGLYGLEHSTSFFDAVNKNKLADGTIPYSASDSLGNVMSVSSGYTNEELEDIYLGKNGHIGYQAGLESKELYDYQNLLDNYAATHDIYKETMKKAMNDATNTRAVGSTTFVERYAEVSTAGKEITAAEGKAYLSELDTYINSMLATKTNGLPLVNNGANNDYYNSLQQNIHDFKYPSFNAGVSFVTGTDNKTIKIAQDVDNYFTIERNSEGNYVVELKDKDGNTLNNNYNYDDEDDDGNISTQNVTFNISGITKDADDQYKFTYTETDPISGKLTYDIKFEDWNPSVGVAPKATETYNDNDERITGDDYLKFIKALMTSIINTADSQYNLEGFYQQLSNPSDTVKNARKDYTEAAKALSKFTFGSETATELKDYDNLLDIDWIKDSHKPTTPQFAIILDVDIMEKVFDTYGEPVYTWVDKNDTNANGEKRAEWLTNLFNRMTKGYKALEDGLASSPQWIKYALESGMLVMEQVNQAKEWTSFIYTNCSDITEKTDNLAITKAEAEYKRSMNDIENKDKRYDMQLKQIDTEHSALQTEYDSIKTVIDKNIERTFKMYSA